MVGALSHTPKGCQFNSRSGCLPRFSQGAHRRQPIDVSLSHRCFSLSFSFLLSLTSIEISSSEDKKYICTRFGRRDIVLNEIALLMGTHDPDEEIGPQRLAKNISGLGSDFMPHTSLCFAIYIPMGPAQARVGFLTPNSCHLGSLVQPCKL